MPGHEEATRHTIDTVCTAFAKSEIGCKIAAEAENALYQQVRNVEVTDVTVVTKSMHDVT